MAARKLKPYQDERTRDAIQATQLVKRLRDHALGLISMTPSQVQAATVLLKKTLPDLVATEHSGSIDIPSVIRAPQVITDSVDWSKAYSPKLKQTEPKPVSH